MFALSGYITCTYIFKYLSEYKYIYLSKIYIADYMKNTGWVHGLGCKTETIARYLKYITVPLVALVLFTGGANAASAPIVSELNNIKLILSQVGPALSAVLFVIAGIFYAIGQLLPPDKKANFHTAAINIIIGAVVVGVLSVAATSLAIASTHLIGNLTVNSSA